MMTENIQAVINSAIQASIQWNNVAIVQRIKWMQRWSELLSAQNPDTEMTTQLLTYHCQRAVELIAKEQVMVGPTGESNILRTTGRGVFVLAADEDAPVAAIVATAYCALVAGNSLILALSASQKALAETLLNIFKEVKAANLAVQVTDKPNMSLLIKEPDIVGVIFIGSQKQAIGINRVLANRTGQIAQLIIETDFKLLSTACDADLILRFITEKTQTINVTAMGGNATLLALGSGDQ